MKQNYDFVIVGAGIVGITIAAELKQRWPESRVLVLEKESRPGLHASGRNSGVLHSGIYYPENSLKAQFCAVGARQLADYCDEHGLPIARLGKVILPLQQNDDTQLDLLLGRARANGAKAEIINNQQLKELEPSARSLSGRALHAPETAVIDASRVLGHLVEGIQSRGVEIRSGTDFRECTGSVDKLSIDGGSITYGTLINAAGLHADRIARIFGAGLDYRIVPFKGLYRKLLDNSGLAIRRLIYPVPDLAVPFLGVHFTKGMDGHVLLGPTAIPALGRENYRGITGLEPLESLSIVWRLFGNYLRNQQNFRHLVHQEGKRIFRRPFAAAARTLVPALRAEHLGPVTKVGIRAQLMNIQSGRLEMDFVVERGRRSIHILNAISPAFTSSFPFARYIVDQHVEQIV